MVNDEAVKEMFAGLQAPDGSDAAANFLRWFGESKAVDAEGAPLVLFHGTAGSFDVFEPSGFGFFGEGVYLTDDAGSASQYATELDEDGECVMPVYARMLNPFVFDAPPAVHEATNASLVKALFRGKERSVVLRSLERNGGIDDQVRDRLEALGHDGLIVRIPFEATEYVVFDPWQLKSASGNSGLFRADADSLTDLPASPRPEAGRRAIAALEFLNRVSSQAAPSVM